MQPLVEDELLGVRIRGRAARALLLDGLLKCMSSGGDLAGLMTGSGFGWEAERHAPIHLFACSSQ